MRILRWGNAEQEGAADRKVHYIYQQPHPNHEARIVG